STGGASAFTPADPARMTLTRREPAGADAKRVVRPSPMKSASSVAWGHASARHAERAPLLARGVRAPSGPRASPDGGCPDRGAADHGAREHRVPDRLQHA